MAFVINMACGLKICRDVKKVLQCHRDPTFHWRVKSSVGLFYTTKKGKNYFA